MRQFVAVCLALVLGTAATHGSLAFAQPQSGSANTGSAADADAQATADGRETLWTPSELSVHQMARGGYIADLKSTPVTDLRLKASVLAQFENYRSQAPLNTMVRLLWEGPGLLEGHLLCDIYANSVYIGSWKSQELVVSDQVLQIPVMLPPSPLYNARDPYSLHLVFQTKDTRFHIESRDLAAESNWSREYVSGIVTPENVRRLRGFTKEDSPAIPGNLFQLSQYHPDRAFVPQLVVTPVQVKPIDLPVDPLRYSSFDILLVSAESINLVSVPQWKALLTWIRAGGRMCLVSLDPVPRRLQPLLQQTLNERPDTSVMTFDEPGNIRTTNEGPLHKFRVGNGKVLLVTGPVDVSTPQWRLAEMWLHSLRQHRIREIANGGSWNMGPVPPEIEPIHPLVPAARPLHELKQALRPDGMKQFSSGKLVMLLGACLLLIGPVDYFGLGRLGLRRWTWIWVPAASLSMTWATLNMARANVGQNVQQHTATFADLDTTGTVTRSIRLECWFHGNEVARSTSTSGAYRIDFERPNLGWDYYMNPLLTTGQSSEYGGETNSLPPVRYAGIVPGTYQIEEPMFQWIPRTFRETTFGEDPRLNAAPLKALDWPALEQIDWTSVHGQQELGRLIQREIPEARVALRYGIKTLYLDRPQDLNDPLCQLIEIAARATSCPLTVQNIEGRQTGRQPVKRPYGLFGLVRDRAPSCGPELDDLAWIDADDPREAVLMIATGGNHNVIYRRRLERPAPQESASPPTTGSPGQPANPADRGMN